MRVAGIDGTKGGWVAIVLDERNVVADHLLRPIETDFEQLSDATILAIDVPVGFGPREADVAARRFLTGAASTVFATPTREVLESTFRPGLGVSAQAHALGGRIRHVTRLVETDERIYEVHPEVSFRAMNGGRPLRYRKKAAGGAFERLVLLGKHEISLDKLGESASAPLDDVLDAAAAVWTAARIARGEASSLPDPPQLSAGRRGT
jgi:predicted RNase H-like nuclease